VLRPGEKVDLGAYTLTFVGTEQVSEPHRQATIARMAVASKGKDLGVLLPRMNQYESQREPIGTPAVRTFWTEDLYLSIMNLDATGTRLGLLALVNPMVGWIWIATAMMALGGLIALVPRRSETVAVKVQPAAVEAGLATR
jgi:cytochrome c-type biogenesis protein CcmF